MPHPPAGLAPLQDLKFSEAAVSSVMSCEEAKFGRFRFDPARRELSHPQFGADCWNVGVRIIGGGERVSW